MGTAKVFRLPPKGLDQNEGNPEALIEDYLDHMCAPLTGIVPYSRRSRLRKEARNDIEQCVEVRILDGESPMEATRSAIEEYGDSHVVSEQFLEEWLRYLPKGGVARNIGLPMSYATVFFTQASLWGLIWIQLKFFGSDPEPYTFGLSPGAFREIYPEPLPLPQKSWLWFAFLVYVFVAPLIAGWLTGWKALTGAAKSVVTVMLLMTSLCFMAGTLMLPQTEGLWYAVAQLVWWVPAGALTAHLAGVFARRRRFRFQPVRRKKS